MQARGTLARALIVQPDVLLLDEPFGSIDEVTADEIMLDLSPHLAASNCTTILISHNLTQAVFLADRVLTC